jgi:hypothetical protein
MVWVPVALQWVPDSYLGAVIVLIPSGIALIAGAYLIGMARIKGMRE